MSGTRGNKESIRGPFPIDEIEGLGNKVRKKGKVKGTILMSNQVLEGRKNWIQRQIKYK